MEFPIIDITSRKRQDGDDHPLLFNEYCFKKDAFEPDFKNKFYCDCTGQVYQIIDQIVEQKGWRSFFSFLPFVYKEELVFQKVEMKLSLEELRSFALDYAESYGDDESARNLIGRIKEATSVRELLWGW